MFEASRFTSDRIEHGSPKAFPKPRQPKTPTTGLPKGLLLGFFFYLWIDIQDLAKYPLQVVIY